MLKSDGLISEKGEAMIATMAPIRVAFMIVESAERKSPEIFDILRLGSLMMAQHRIGCRIFKSYEEYSARASEDLQSHNKK